MKAIGIFCMALLVASPSAFSGDKGEKSPRDESVRVSPPPPPGFEAKSRDPWVKPETSITPREREIIQRYANGVHQAEVYNHNPRSGTTRKSTRGKELPPGWEKKIVVGKALPEELFKVSERFPAEVIVKLPLPPKGTILVRIEGKAIRLLEPTHQILDVFEIRF